MQVKDMFLNRKNSFLFNHYWSGSFSSGEKTVLSNLFITGLYISGFLAVFS